MTTEVSITVSGDDQPLLQKNDTLVWRAVMLILGVEFCERLAYYGATLVFADYMSVMLGLSTSSTNAGINAFTFWAYFSALLGGYFADEIWGRYKTIVRFAYVYATGLVLLTLSATPLLWLDYPDKAGTATVVVFFTALFLFGLGTGGIKANVSIMIANQLDENDEKDVERVFRWFYWSINAGALIGVGLTPSLHDFGPKVKDSSGGSLGSSFYYSFAFPSFCFLLATLLFYSGRNIYKKQPPQASLLRQAISALIDPTGYSQIFLDEVYHALRICQVFLFFPVYWLLYNQMTSNFILQAGWMERPFWLPAEQLNLVDAVMLVTLIPLFDKFIFPFFRSKGIELKPVRRMTIGFIISASAFFYAAVLQSNIAAQGHWDGDEYHSHGPKVSVWLQIPAYVLIAVSEIFAAIASLEFAYAQAPASMKSIVMALFLLTNAGGSLLGLLLTPVFQPSNFEIIFYVFAGTMAVFAAVFYFSFRKFDHFS